MKKVNAKLWIGLLIMIALAAIGISSRILAYIKLKQSVEQSNIPPVAVTTAQTSPATEEIVLPGNVQGWHTTDIYARTNGYTINWLVDIGDHVKAGQLLATIATPELDEQLHQAEANLQAAEVNAQLAGRTAQRFVNLLKTDSVSKQDTDIQVSGAQSTQAVAAANRANRNQFAQLVSFEEVRAPFAGVITSRLVDIGRLIDAGAASNQPLFSITQSNPLYVYVRVPEYYAGRIKSGLTVQLGFREYPGESFAAKILNTAQAIDVPTRTLLAQFKVDNPDGKLLPGSYSQVNLKIPGSTTSVILPVNTLIFRAQGMQVACVGQNNTATLKSVTIGRDFGDTVEIVAGLKAGEKVILNPPSTLSTGQKIKLVSTGK